MKNLLRVSLKRKSHIHGSTNHIEPEPSGTTGQRSAKRQRKTDHPYSRPVANKFLITASNDNSGETVCCSYSALQS